MPLNLNQTTAATYPTVTTTVNGSGSGGSWANPANVFSDNAANATAAYLLDGGGSKAPLAFLVVKTFGFAIPSNAVIDGIKMEYEVVSSNRWSEGLSNFRMMKAGVAAGTNKAGTGVAASGVWSYGGSTELWGQTWTPAEINHADFGVQLDFDGLTSSPADYSISIDFVRVTIYWHYSVDVAAADVPTRFLYKIYSNQNQYLGNLPNPSSEFGFPQDINSAGSSITIDVPLSPDTSISETDYLITEAGDYITDESNNRIRIDAAAFLAIGTGSGGTLIQNGNKVYVYMYNYYYPNGKLMFSGQINRIQASFGGDSEDLIKLLVLSDGIDLDNLIARGSPFTYTDDVIQTTQNATATVNQDKGTWNRVGQTWVCGVGVTKLGAITLLLNGTADVTVTVYNGVSGTAIGSVTRNVNTAGAAVVTQLALASLITVVPGNTYFFTISVDDGQSMIVYYSNLDPYAGGVLYSSSYGGGSGGGGYIAIPAYDLYFKASAGTATTTATYTSKNPTTEMLKPIIDDYVLRGGLINYSSSSVDATLLSLTVTFNTDTILDAIKRIQSVCPSNFYWYVDLSTNTIFFKQTSTTADFTLIKGRNLKSINLVMSIENVKNKELFSGGPTAGVNLYTEYNDTASQTLYGVRLDRKSDNRVTVQATANAIGDSFISTYKNEAYETTVTVLGTEIDLTLLKVGKTVGLRGFGSFVDTLLLQIVRIEYHPEFAILTLGTLPVRQSDQIEAITRGLVAEQTVANPATPS